MFLLYIYIILSDCTIEWGERGYYRPACTVHSIVHRDVGVAGYLIHRNLWSSILFRFLLSTSAMTGYFILVFVDICIFAWLYVCIEINLLVCC
jgi:hypothetical protein